jgi:peptidoglycan/xylan/chitin deacetylase (PgdA/CDA1 family)
MTKTSIRGILLRSTAVLTGIFLALSTGIGATQAAGALVKAAVTGPTVVSLTFDDGNDNQFAAAQVLKANGLHGTFFITTSWIGQSSWLTQAELRTMAADGNEIGGHTVTHPDLTLITAAQATAEVCDSRTTLASWGFDATAFAYPFAAVNTSVQSIVAGCGYTSARTLGDLRSPASCTTCKFAESIPPANAMDTAAPDEVDSTWTLQDLQGTVTNAEANGGGWVQLSFHHIAVGTDPTLTISPTLFSQFVVWLAARGTTNNTVVQTVGQVIGGTSASVLPATPTISGTAQTGSVLTAVPGSWNPGTATFGYQWLGNGAAIAGATSASYTPGAADVGKTLSVQVTGSATGYLSASATSAATAPVGGAAGPATASRLWGADAYGTSAAVSAGTFATPGVPVAYVATGVTYQDALSGAGAAGVNKGPVLLVQPNGIPGVIAAELSRLKPVRIVVLGGNQAVSDGVLASLAGFAPTTRLWGADAYGTSAAVSAGTFATPGVPVAYVATGATYQDALSGAAAAGVNKGPVLLVQPNGIPGVIAAELQRLKPARIVVLGGNQAVSDAVMAQALALVQ